MVVEQALGDVQDPLARQPDPLEGDVEVALVRLVGADLLGGDDPVEGDAEPPGGRGEQVVVAVGDDAEPEPLRQPRERRGRVRERGPVGDGGAERRELRPPSARTPARRPRRRAPPRRRRGSADTARPPRRPRGGRSGRSRPRRPARCRARAAPAGTRRPSRPPSRSGCRSSRTSARRSGSSRARSRDLHELHQQPIVPVRAVGVALVAAHHADRPEADLLVGADRDQCCPRTGRS